jgi:anthranilate synthase component 1
MKTGKQRLVTTREAFIETAADGPQGVRVPVEYRIRVGDPFRAYRRARNGQGGMYLETTGGQTGWGYFGTDPVSRLQVGPDLEPIGDVNPSPSIAELAGLLERETLVRGDCDVPYPCGAFGWLSYDIARELEALPATTVDDRGLPRLQLGVYDRIAAWEEPRSEEWTTLSVTACPRVGDDPRAAFDRGRERALDLIEDITSGTPTVEGSPTPATSATFESDCPRSEFRERVRTVKEYIRDGDTFQANISQRLRAPAVVQPIEAFSALREVNPAQYSELLEFPGVDLVSA